MRKRVSLSAILLSIACLVGAALVGASPAQASYGGHAGKLDVYQIAISFNCNNAAFCSPGPLGGFWGWGELDQDPTTGMTSGDAQLEDCAHGLFNGAQHTTVEILNWWIAPGSAGPSTFYTNEIDTVTYRGQTQVVTINSNDIGVPAVPGHYSTTDIFGQQMPPGVSAQIQVAFKPAH